MPVIVNVTYKSYVKNNDAYIYRLRRYHDLITRRLLGICTGGHNVFAL